MIFELADKKPLIHPSAFVAPGAMVIGDVEIGENSSVWFNCTVRGDVYHIRIGKNSNIQDNSVLHVTTGKHATIIGDHVTVGHHATIHGATLADHAFVGIGATVLDRVVIQPFGFVAAGALVPPGFEVPEKTLVAGVPAKIIRTLKDEEVDMILRTASSYSQHARFYRENLKV